MGTHQTADYEQILAVVRTWPAAQRFTLVQDVLSTLAPTQTADSVSRPTLDQARGLLAATRPAPSDEQIAGWLDERRTERYGV